MVCQICGSVRLISKERIFCPQCDNVVVNPSINEIEVRVKEFSQLISNFDNELFESDFNHIIGSASVNREVHARYSVNMPNESAYAIVTWLANYFIISRATYLRKNIKGNKLNYSKLMGMSRNIIVAHRDLELFQNDEAKSVSINGKNQVVLSEHQPLRFIPENTMEEFRKKFESCREDHFLGLSEDYGVHAEIILYREFISKRVKDLIDSLRLSDNIKKVFPKRLLPNLRGNDVDRFIEMSDLLLGYLFSHPDLIYRNAGIFLTNRSNLNYLQKICFKDYTQSEIDWYFSNLISTPNGSLNNLGASTIFIDEQTQAVHIPTFTLLLLQSSSFRWLKSPRVGQMSNEIGQLVEDLFFINLQAYQIKRTHPLTGKKLIRIPHPEKRNEEIADVMGYNDKTLVIVETKFWDTPILEKLEEELEKFHLKVNYIKNNLDKFGFSHFDNILPIFYSPYAPHCIWNDIQLVYSTLMFHEILLKYFPKIKYSLDTTIDPKLIEILENISTIVPYPTDINYFDKKIPTGTYRIQDLCVLRYDENEVTAFYENPLGHSWMIYIDITPELYQKLKSDNIRKGDIITGVIKKIVREWLITQLVYYKRQKSAEAYSRLVEFTLSIGRDTEQNTKSLSSV